MAMAFEFRLPQFTGSDKEQLAQLRNYLYQFIPKLEWALNTIDTGDGAIMQTEATARKTVQTTASFDAEVAFDVLKPLIIKSADIVQAYYEEINTRLESKYVAESDFGTFIEENAQEISRNATDIEQILSNMQTILTDIENLNFTLAEVNAYIRSGMLYHDEDGVPVYGLEIGQRNSIDGEEVFSKFARFTAEKLSFYDQNGTEVGYISDHKLCITHVQIKGSLQRGGYKEFIDADGGIITKWVGW